MINFGVTERKTQELDRRMHNCNLLENDIEEKFVRSSGAGGQKVNKSSTCVHLKHICSGLAVKVQKSRSQGLNRYYAGTGESLSSGVAASPASNSVWKSPRQQFELLDAE